MWPHLQGIDIECWRHTGRLGTSEPFLCLYKSNAESCDLLLRAIDELEASDPPAKLGLTFRSSRRNNNCSRMRMSLSKASDDLRKLHISVDGRTAVVEMTLEGLYLFRKAVEAWREGEEDFCLSPASRRYKRHELGERDRASGELWFWGPTYLGP